LRQKLRKYNKDFETELQNYRVDPDPIGYSSGAAEEDDEELETKQPAAPEALKVEKKDAKIKTKNESDIDSESWESDSSDDSNESDIDFDIRDKKIEELRVYFLK
jgi:translation initiation factor 3 subunit C